MPAGRADRLLSQLAAAQADLTDLGNEVPGPLRIGGVGSAVRTLLPDAPAALTEAHPRPTPTVVDGGAVDLLPRLLDGGLDLRNVEPGLVGTEIGAATRDADLRAALGEMRARIEPLTARDIADALAFSVVAPRRVPLAELVVMPVQQG
ncbi:hypothetical protein [Streptomyces albospinus]|uniref:hypothetical protein n=1 Tax=Streptomyces albospinus TaxID=285515 RepID=UPI0016703965|nr:hypothetical protein [Streptomyces albospinus]